jgi:hypothetical protein
MASAVASARASAVSSSSAIATEFPHDHAAALAAAWQSCLHAEIELREHKHQTNFSLQLKFIMAYHIDVTHNACIASQPVVHSLSLSDEGMSSLFKHSSKQAVTIDKGADSKLKELTAWKASSRNRKHLDEN